MKKTNNNSYLNSKSVADSLANGGFIAPEGYFDELENNIIKSTINNKIKLTHKRNSVNFVSIASVAATLIIGFAFAAYFELKNPDTIFKSHAKNRKETKSSNATNNQLTKDLIDSLKTNQSNSFVKMNTKSADIPNSNFISSTYQTQNTILYSEKTQSKEIDKSFTNNNAEHNIISNNSISNNFVNPNIYINPNTTKSNLPIISAAKLSRINKNKLFGNDTCGIDEMVLSPINALEGYNFTWSTGENRSKITVKKSGLYWLKATSQNELIIDSIYVSIIEEPYFNLENEIRICTGESVIIDSKLSNSEYKYIWSHSSLNSSKIELRDLRSGYYKIKLRVNYCSSSKDDVVLLVVEDCEIKIPNVITPNGDGINDQFEISGLEKYPGSSLRIFDRNGKTIYESINYTNDWNPTDLTAGTYFFILKVNNNQKTEKGGTLSIVK